MINIQQQKANGVGQPRELDWIINRNTDGFTSLQRHDLFLGTSNRYLMKSAFCRQESNLKIPTCEPIFTCWPQLFNSRFWLNTQAHSVPSLSLYLRERRTDHNEHYKEHYKDDSTPWETKLAILYAKFALNHTKIQYFGRKFRIG